MRIKGYVPSFASSQYSCWTLTRPLFNSINNIAPKPKKILQLLRLLQINNGVFVKVSKATSQMLLMVEPYITYGFVQFSFHFPRQPLLIYFNACSEPNLKTIRELIYKRGNARPSLSRYA